MFSDFESKAVLRAEMHGVQDEVKSTELSQMKEGTWYIIIIIIALCVGYTYHRLTRYTGNIHKMVCDNA